MLVPEIWDYENSSPRRSVIPIADLLMVKFAGNLGTSFKS